MPGGGEAQRQGHRVSVAGESAFVPQREEVVQRAMPLPHGEGPPHRLRHDEWTDVRATTARMAQSGIDNGWQDADWELTDE